MSPVVSSIIASPITQNLAIGSGDQDIVVCSSTLDTCSCILGPDLCQAPCSNTLNEMFQGISRLSPMKPGTLSDAAVSPPSTPTKKRLHFSDASTSTLSPSNGGYPCSADASASTFSPSNGGYPHSPLTYMSGGVENPRMRGTICVSSCSQECDGVSRVASTVVYSDSD